MTNVLGSRPRGSITSISKEVDVDVFDTLCFGSFDEFENVGDMRVDTSVRNETTEVKSRPVLFGVLERSDNVGLTSELLLLNACSSAYCKWTWHKAYIDQS